MSNKLNLIAKALGVKETQEIINLILDLEFEIDRMSQCGQETYEKLLTTLEVE
jgi:hypothetical protein